MKKLFRFYCEDCDNAWHDLLEETEAHSHCDYCQKPADPEELKHD